MTYLRELFGSRELLVNLTMREVKGKYRRTALGQLWSLINPLATLLVYSIVFGFIFQARRVTGDPSGLEIYPIWLMCGLIPWLFFVRVVNGALSSITSNAALIKKVYFPRMTLPLSIVGSVGFTWINEMILIFIVLTIAGAFIWPFLPLVIVFMVLLAAFAVGFGMMLAIANVYFRDVQHFVAILLQMWMYLTPIIYPLSYVREAAAQHGEWILVVYRLNPMERFVATFRQLLYDNRIPELSDMLWCAGWGIGFLVLGALVFARNDKRFAELL